MKKIDEILLQLEAEIDSSDKYIAEYEDTKEQRAFNAGLRHAYKVIDDMRKEDYKMKERKFTIEVTMNERWVDAFCSFLKHLEVNGKVGHSEYVTIFADGDGDFRSEFNINTEFDKTKSFDYKGGIHTSIYDAGQGGVDNA